MPQIHLTAIMATFAALPAMAQDQTETEAAFLPRLIDSACIDIHDNIGCETLVLLRSETDESAADLIIITDFRDTLEDNAGSPLLIVRNIAFNGAMWGMAPSISKADNQAFLLISQQSGIGRNPWEQTLTIAWRNDKFTITRYNFSSYDRMNGGFFSCDVDFLIGVYSTEVSVIDSETEEEKTTRETGDDAARDIALADWNAYSVGPEICDSALAEYYDN